MGLPRGLFTAKVLDGHRAESTGEALKENIPDEQVIVFTDQSTSYVDIADFVEPHIPER